MKMLISVDFTVTQKTIIDDYSNIFFVHFTC